VESAYTERVARSGWAQPFPEHIHTLICAVNDDERAMRQRLNENLDYSYSTGDWPHVPQRGEGHGRSGGEPQDSGALAGKSADGAVVGNPQEVTAALKDYIAATGASRIVLFMEPIVDGELLEESIRRFAAEVMPAVG
jgi:alkanesulfonate monooxygenase SsuD/methylene tetrahydromethanopterin reductase-like flavin-dependent oxidoreductase (luciferase family)